MYDTEVMLQEIAKPEVDMYVIWVNDNITPKRIWNIKTLGELRAVIKSSNSTSENVMLSELKQVVGEFTTNGGMHKLPIRPRDLEWTIQHLGEKIKTKKEDIALGLETTPKPGLYITELKHGEWLKIIHSPTDDELWTELTKGECSRDMPSLNYYRFNLLNNLKRMLLEAKL